MAFVMKGGRGWCVHKGNSGEVLSCFSGKDAKKKAESEMARLHRKNRPSSANRGKTAQKRNERRKKR